MATRATPRPPATDEEKIEAVRLYFEENWYQKDIAKKFHTKQQVVSRWLNEPEVLERYEQRMRAKAIRSRIRVLQATEKAVDVQVGYLGRELPQNMEYLRQNAARDILDRGNIRVAPDSEAAQINVVLDGVNLTLGMPPSAGEIEEPTAPLALPIAPGIPALEEDF